MMKKDDSQIPPLAVENAEAQAAWFLALSHPLRLRILSLLKEAPDGMAAKQFLTLLDEHGVLSQQSVNHHLVALKRANLVGRRRRKNESHYHLRAEILMQAYTAIGDLLPVQRRRPTAIHETEYGG